jgi:hypothetical protein
MNAAVFIGLKIEKHGLIHAVGSNPGLHLCGCRIFAELFTGYSFRRCKNVKEQEGNYAHTQYSGNGKKQSTDYIVRQITFSFLNI